MKKIALLITLVLIFSLSCVFATDTAAPLTVTSAVTSGETLSGEDIITQVEVSGEIEDSSNVTEEVSGELEDVVSGESEYVEDVENIEDDENETTESSNSGATIGAIIAIIIVVAVVAIAAILRKD